MNLVGNQEKEKELFMSYTVDFSEDFRPFSESELNDVNMAV
jgi:hypothetical protein